jgi:hypothetical protein
VVEIERRCRGGAVEHRRIRDRGRDGACPRQLHEHRAGIPPEGIGLRRPVQIPERRGKPVEMMLRRLVIVEDHVHGVHR